MRTRINILLSLLLLSVCAVAQPRLTQRSYCVGIQGGVSASTVLFSPTVANMTPITETAHLGGNAGVSFRYSGHNHCGLQVEVNYQQRGWREVNKTSGIDYQRTLHYISVPFLTHIYFGKNGANGFINLGPQIGYCFRDVAKGTKNPSLAHQYDALDQPFDWGIAGGVGFYYKTKKAGIYQIDIRVDYSLGTIYNTRTTDYFSQANPLDVSINLGYYWEFKGKGGRR